MGKLIYASCLWFMSVFLFGHIEQCVAPETHEPHIEEMTFFVTSQDLYFDNDDMMVVVGERSYPVRSLQRSGNQWEVQVVSAGYCQLGHNLCRNCGTCHKKGCIYYIPPCKLWN